MSDEFEIKTMLKEHIDASNKYRDESIRMMAEIKTHHTYTKEALNKHDCDIEKLKSNLNFRNHINNW